MAKKVLVVLDPGHCPKYNKGAVAGYYEGDKMYTFSEYERDALKRYGINVIITRERSKDMELYARGQVAVKNGKGYDEVVFISNHSNAFNGTACGAVGFRSAYLPKDSNLALGQKIVDACVSVMKPVTGCTYSRGVLTKVCDIGDYYGVIRGSVSGAKSEAQAKKGPVTYSFIIEHGFHDNVKECTFLNNDSNLKKMAEAEAKAIADYFGLKEVSNTTATNSNKGANTLKINGFNIIRSTDYLVIYNRGKGVSTGTNKWGTEVAFDDKCVAISNPVYGVGNMQIPANGFVLSGHGKMSSWILDNIKKGTKLDINVNV